MFDEVLHRKHIQAQLLSLLQEMFLRVYVVTRNRLRASRLSKRHLVLDLLSLSLGPGQGRDTALPHVADKLARQLIQSFFG